MLTCSVRKIHYWDKLTTIAETASDDPKQKQTCKDLERLLECIRAAPELEKYFKTRDSNLSASITSYDTLWTLFAPKTQVIAKPFMKMLQVFEVESFRSLLRRQLILVWYWDWNGKKVIKIHHWLSINRFSGTKDINQLSCYPIQYYKTGQEELKKTLRARGEKFNRIVRSKTGASQMYTYSGDAVLDGQSAIKFGNQYTVKNSSLSTSTTYANSVQGQ